MDKCDEVALRVRAEMDGGLKMLAECFFQCARSERPSIDWKAAMDNVLDEHARRLRAAWQGEPVAWRDEKSNLVLLETYAIELGYGGSFVALGRAIPHSWTPVLYTHPQQGVVVPEDATRKMADAGLAAWSTGTIFDMWKAMLASRPAQGAQNAETVPAAPTQDAKDAARWEVRTPMRYGSKHEGWYETEHAAVERIANLGYAGAKVINHVAYATDELDAAMGRKS